MTGNVLLDTNVIVYAYDRSNRSKQQRALEAMRGLVRSGRGRLSAQVLGEFYRVVTGKLAPALTAPDAHSQVTLLAQAWPVLPITSFIVLEATRGARDHRLPYWDAQVWATARLNQIETVLTEDFTDGQAIEGVRFVDPFSRSFDLARLS
jgi:predicted nucleic acid-binding protein